MHYPNGEKKTENDDGVDDRTMDNYDAPDGLPQRNTKKKGRQSSPRFEYNTNFEMQRLFQQQLSTKQSLPFSIGKAPPQRPGNTHLQMNQEPLND